ncbi:MAG: hypothetical protein ACP5UQ_00275 [Anaerolineae bacterium]
MLNHSENERPAWLVPVICFLIGLLIGWWAIGWGIWPVKWTNALPVDLRAEERDQYLAMVAESYAATRNADLARERLKSWPADELAQHLANLQMRAGPNTPQAAQVQALIDLMAATKPAAPGPQTPARAPTQVPRSTPTPAAGVDLGAALRRAAMILLWLLLFIAAIAVAYWLWNRWRRAHQVQPAAAIDVGARTRRPAPAVQPPLAESTAEPPTAWSIAEEPPAAEAAEAAPRSDDTGDREPTPPRPAATSFVRPPARTLRPAGAFTRLGEFTAIYQMGEPDYDEAFDLVDPAGNFMGQCGLALHNPIGRNRDQAAALEAWLWDGRDPDTKVKVLMSEGGYRDTALREQLRGDRDALPIRPGTEFELDTHRLLLRGRVEKVEYADLEPAYTIFAELVVRFQVDWNGATD